MILCIVDGAGNQVLKRGITEETQAFETRNLERHIEKAKENPKLYRFFDAKTARIEVL